MKCRKALLYLYTRQQLRSFFSRAEESKASSPIVCSCPCATLDLGEKEVQYAHPGKRGEEKESMRKLGGIPSFMKRKLKSSPIVLSQFFKCCISGVPQMTPKPSDLLDGLRTEIFFFLFLLLMAKIYYHGKNRKRKRCIRQSWRKPADNC